MGLAERLGGMTSDELLLRMSSEELTEWLAHDRTHVPDSWWQADAICRSFFAATTGKWPPVGSFVPGYKVPIRRQTSDEIKAVLMAAAGPPGQPRARRLPSIPRR